MSAATRMAMFSSLVVALVTSTLTFTQAQAASGGSMNMGSMSTAAPLTPAEQATNAYNAGIKIIKDADQAQTDAAQASDAKQQQKANDRANKYFTKAVAKFEAAVALKPDMYQAWNMLGYSRRNLGNYSGALQAYDQALQLNPQYLEAVEYRGHAYLGLNRLADAKQAYLDLFAANRALADKLLAAMKNWLTSRQANPAGVDSTTLQDFTKWVDERGTIASNTAGLAPTDTLARWP